MVARPARLLDLFVPGGFRYESPTTARPRKPQRRGASGRDRPVNRGIEGFLAYFALPIGARALGNDPAIVNLLGYLSSLGFGYPVAAARHLRAAAIFLGILFQVLWLDQPITASGLAAGRPVDEKEEGRSRGTPIATSGKGGCTFLQIVFYSIGDRSCDNPRTSRCRSCRRFPRARPRGPLRGAPIWRYGLAFHRAPWIGGGGDRCCS